MLARSLMSNARRQARLMMRLKPNPTTILDEDGVPVDGGRIDRLTEKTLETNPHEPVDTKGILFRVTDEMLDGILGEDRGWAGVFVGGLEIIPTSGDHLSMIRSAEHNEALAQKTKEVLQRVCAAPRLGRSDGRTRLTNSAA